MLVHIHIITKLFHYYKVKTTALGTVDTENKWEALTLHSTVGIDENNPQVIILLVIETVILIITNFTCFLDNSEKP